MKLLFSGSIRRVLTILVCLAVLPSLILIIFSGLELRRKAIDNAKREVLMLARTMGEVQTGITRSTRQILSTLGKMQAVHDMDAEACNEIFRAVVDDNPAFVNIIAMDARGEVFASSMPFDQMNLSDRHHVRLAVAHRHFAPGEYIQTRIGPQVQALPYAHPVLDKSGEVRVVLAAALHLSRFADFFDVASLPPNSFMAVTDQKGIRLFFHPSREATNPIGQPIAAAARKHVQGKKDPGISVHAGSDGMRRIFGYQPIRLYDDHPPYAYLWAGVPETAILRPANKILLRNLVLMAIVAALALVIANLTGGRTLLMPIRRLVNTARAFADGDLNDRAGDIPAPDELRTLGKAFDEMAEALVDNQERLCTIADYTYDWEYWIGPDDRPQWVSPSCQRITGYLAAEFMADPSLFQSIVYEDDQTAFKEHLILAQDLSRAGRIDFRIVHKSGRLVWIDHHCLALKTSAGKFLGRRVSNRDITDRKQMETRLQQAQKNEAIGALAGGIAHDFNNILSPIIGLSEMLIEDLPHGSLERENVAEIHTAARRAGDLVKQILSFSRQAEHKKIPLRIQQVLKEAGKLVRSTIPKNIAIEQSIQADCGPVMADPTNIHQVAMNLITNAYHALEDNGGTIAISLKQVVLAPEDVTDTYLTPGPHALFSVSDTGCGISVQVLPRIFDPYFTTKAQGKGTGLGLAVVYGIVREHGGDVRVYTEINRGTIFKVYLPLLPRESAADALPAPPALPTGTERILLADDEESIVRMETLMLERLGYRITPHTSSTAALAAFKADPAAFDLVITDMAMPTMTGDQLARHISAIRPDIPVIICTGFSEQTTVKEADQSPLRGFLMKPVVRSDLAREVRRVLDQAKKANNFK